MIRRRGGGRYAGVSREGGGDGEEEEGMGLGEEEGMQGAK